MTLELVVGTYAASGGPGLVRLRGDADGWARAETVPHIRNASFGVRSQLHDLWYFVDEDEDRLGVYGPDGWKRVADVGAWGGAPCHFALHAAERHLAVAHYGSGSVALFRLDDRGRPVEPPAIRRNSGCGPDPDRQDGPHAHWVGFDRDAVRLFCVDLGADQILAFDLESGMGEPRIAWQAPPGSGPRHLALHPLAPFAFLVSELASTLTVLCHGNDGGLTALHTCSTLPVDAATTGNLGGAIALNGTGDRLYVSNRGHDSIAIFALGSDGIPTLLQHVASGGTSPRFILLVQDQRELVVAHEQGGGVAIFQIDADGRLSSDPTRIEIPGAAFIGRVHANGAQA